MFNYCWCKIIKIIWVLKYLNYFFFAIFVLNLSKNLKINTNAKF